MNYKKNECGDVVCRRASGDLTYIPEHLANDKPLMDRMGLTPIENPVVFEFEAKKEQPKKEQAVAKETEKEKVKK